MLRFGDEEFALMYWHMIFIRLLSANRHWTY